MIGPTAEEKRPCWRSQLESERTERGVFQMSTVWERLRGKFPPLSAERVGRKRRHGGGGDLPEDRGQRVQKNTFFFYINSFPELLRSVSGSKTSRD